MKKDNKYDTKLEADLEKAIKIYYKIAFGKKVDKLKISFLTSHAIDRLEDKSNYEIKLGMPVGQQIFKETSLRIYKKGHLISVEDNASCTVDGIREGIENKCLEIEKALIEAGLPVKKLYSEQKNKEK
jgi:hypothetical protein